MLFKEEPSQNVIHSLIQNGLITKNFKLTLSFLSMHILADAIISGIGPSTSGGVARLMSQLEKIQAQCYIFNLQKK